MSIPNEIRSRIVDALSDLEKKHRIKIVYACESGSRAWGFASQDSDFDVRFLYVHDRDWYLSIELEDRRDVVELPISDVLDINGWDLRKVLRLFRKSNPPLLEWLGSSIVYLETGPVASQLRRLALKYHSPVACAYHYLHMAKGNYREFLRGEQVWRKKYLYVLRPLLAIKWIELDLGVVPTPFDVLVNQTVTSKPLKNAIAALLEEKRRGFESDRGPRIDEISEFIESELARLADSAFNKKPPLPPSDDLDLLFREALETATGESCQV